MTALQATEPVAATPPGALAGRVPERELARLLGYPDGRIPAGRARRRAAEARARYRRHGNAFVRLRRVGVVAIDNPLVELTEGEPLSSASLARRLRRAAAPALLVVAVGAGAGADRRCEELWQQGRPDEAYFLDRLAAAVTEYLAAWIGARLRRAEEAAGRGLLAPYSPGYPGWALEEQGTLVRLLAGSSAGSTAGSSPAPPFRLLASGMIEPRSSLLTAFGVAARPAATLPDPPSPCRHCGLATCGFRRPRPLPPPQGSRDLRESPGGW